MMRSKSCWGAMTRVARIDNVHVYVHVYVYECVYVVQ